jgi:hypothetical protein
MRSSRRRSATTSDSQYWRRACRSSCVHGPPRRASCLQSVEPKVDERAEQAVIRDRGESVREISELDEEVQDVGGEIPAEFKMTPQFGTCVVGDEQRVRARAVGRCFQGQELVLPDVKRAPRAEFGGDKADRPGTLSRPCGEFEVD